MKLFLEKKSFSFEFPNEIINSKYKISQKKGWIIKLKNEYNQIGFGDISPIQQIDFKICQKEINKLPRIISENNLKETIKRLHPCIQSGINSSLAEMKGLITFKNYYPFEEIDETAILLKSKRVLEDFIKIKNTKKYKNKNLTIKWKVAIEDNIDEEKILEFILSEIPQNIKIRIDANGAWSRNIAKRWADILKNNKNLDWLEQPLEENDIEGLNKLLEIIPIALDESLIKFPELIHSWDGWQIRRPSQEANPIKLFEDLVNKRGYISLSSSFETGIGRRFLYSCALEQLEGPTPKVPGLALRQTPKSFLFSNDPKFIWGKL